MSFQQAFGNEASYKRRQTPFFRHRRREVHIVMMHTQLPVRSSRVAFAALRSCAYCFCALASMDDIFATAIASFLLSASALCRISLSSACHQIIRSLSGSLVIGNPSKGSHAETLVLHLIIVAIPVLEQLFRIPQLGFKLFIQHLLQELSS